MTDERKWQESVQIGFQVFDKDGGEEFGAVREVCPAGRLELLVHIENGGDHCIPLDAIVDVHSEKVIWMLRGWTRRCGAKSRTPTMPNSRGCEPRGTHGAPARGAAGRSDARNPDPGMDV